MQEPNTPNPANPSVGYPSWLLRLTGLATGAFLGLLGAAFINLIARPLDLGLIVSSLIYGLALLAGGVAGAVLGGRSRSFGVLAVGVVAGTILGNVIELATRAEVSGFGTLIGGVAGMAWGAWRILSR